MFGLTICPVFRSRMRSSYIAKFSEPMMPPYTWLSAVRRLTTRPQSWMASTRVSLTMPVSTSTVTSANCTPLVVTDERPGLPVAIDGDRLRADVLARLGPREPLAGVVLHVQAAAGGDERRGLDAEHRRDLLLQRVERLDRRDADGRADARGRRAAAGHRADAVVGVANLRGRRDRRADRACRRRRRPPACACRCRGPACRRA